MQTLMFEFPATASVRRPAHVGVVGSGDLEVLVQPVGNGAATVRVRTEVDGFGEIWEHVLRRFFARHPVAGAFELNDAGATPGVVTLRLRQAIEDASR